MGVGIEQMPTVYSLQLEESEQKQTMQKFSIYVLVFSGCIVFLCLLNLQFSETTRETRKGVPVEPLSIKRAADFKKISNLSKGNVADLSATEIREQLANLKHVANVHRQVRFESLLRHWAKLDEQGAFEYADSLEDREMKRRAIETVAEVLAHSDPQFLARNILGIRDSESEVLIRKLADAWSQTDALSALAWAQQLPEGQVKENALLMTRYRLASQDPEAVAMQIDTLDESDSTSSLVAAVAEAWALKDPAKALAWAGTLPGSEQTLAMAKVAKSWAGRDPAAAANFVAQLSAGEMQNEAARSVISSWANRDPEAAAAWVSQFPAGDLRDRGINLIVTDWNMIDPGKARDWVLNLPVGAPQNIAFKSFAESIVYSLSDPFAQEQAMASIMHSWSQSDPAAARNWLAGWSGTDALKTSLQSLLVAN